MYRFILPILAILGLLCQRTATSGELAQNLQQPILVPGEATAQHSLFVQARITQLKLPSSAEAWQAEAAQIRQRVLDEVVFRGVPPSWRQPQPTVVWGAEIETGNGYRIRKLRLEALPGLWIPALLYEPQQLAGKTPAILNVNGHAATGKSTDYKQLRCVNLAKRGMLALNLEWIGMGQLQSPGYSHNQLALLDLCGRSGLSVFYLAMSRGLDVLLAHPSTDPDRVAVTGLSGGGWQTIILSSLDTRVKLATPVAGHSALTQRLASRNSVGDLEQNPNDLISIADYVHLNALMTPRPMLSIYNTKDDCCFVANTVKSNTYEPVIPFYQQAGVPAAWQYYENSDPGTHNYDRDNREQFYRFVNGHFFPGEERSSLEIPSADEVLSHDALNVPLPESNANFHTLAAQAAAELPKPQGGSPQQQRERLKEVLRYEPLAAVADLVDAVRSIDGRKLARFRLKLGTEWTIPAVCVDGPTVEKTVLLLADTGFASQAERIEALTAEAVRVIAVDPVLIGQASPAGGPGQNAMLMATVGQRPLGIQTAQLMATIRWVAETYSVDQIEVQTVGPRTGLIALAAAALDGGQKIARVEAGEVPESLKAFLQPNARYNDTPEAYCFGLLEWFDIKDLRRLAQADKAQPVNTIINAIGMKLRRIPAGDFLRGSSGTDPGAREDEMPQHRVRISRPFYLGVHEVTQAAFQALMETNPSSFTRARLLKDEPTDLDFSRLPADNVTWHAAVEFCRRLSELPAEKQAGRVYRLPTEAEWEYSCRAGTTSVFHFGNTLSSTQANFNGAHPFGEAEQARFLNRTTVVGSYEPNAFGLFDMHGNLHEWCMDRFGRDYYRESPDVDPSGPAQGTARVIRGGDWYSDGRDCRSAFRYADIPEGRFYALGMRVVCELVSEGASLDPTIAAAGKSNDRLSTATAVAKLADSPQPTAGEDWPRWRGPRGDGTWRAAKLPPVWPKDGLQRVWKQELGGGYGGIAASDGRVYVMDRQRDPDDIERILSFDAVTGKRLWSRAYPVNYGGVSYDNGPRATPTVFQGRVYTLGAVGNLLCLDAITGDPVWSKDLVAEFGARVPIWGLSASPLVFEGLLIVHAGGQPDACFVALDLETGVERWRNLPDAAGYATPILIDRGGTQQLVAWTPSNVRGLDPATGELLWTVPFEVNYGTSIANPIYHEELVLVSSYYEGSQAIRLSAGTDQAQVVWHDRRNLRGLMTQPLYRDGYAFLLDKRHGLTCFQLATGKKVWDDDNRMTPKGRNPQANMVWLGDEDRAIVLNSDGDLILVRLNANGYEEQARTNIIGRTWAHPAYAGNCVYARSDTEIVCVLLPSAKR